jgi:hypothetical protein
MSKVSDFVHQAWKTVNNSLCATRNRCFVATDLGIADVGPPVHGIRLQGGYIAEVGECGYLFVCKRIKLAVLWSVAVF